MKEYFITEDQIKEVVLNLQTGPYNIVARPIDIIVNRLRLVPIYNGVAPKDENS